MNFKKSVSALAIASCFVVFISSCKKDNPTPTTVYTSDPVGTQTSLKTGSIINANGPGTSGTLSIVQDANSNQFVKLNSDFMSGFSTGTVVVYLAKTSESIKTQRNGGTTASNIQAVGFVGSNGQHYLKIPTSYSGFSYVVIYCETAEINFGYATLN
jgi:hypothetical protein